MADKKEVEDTGKKLVLGLKWDVFDPAFASCKPNSHYATQQTHIRSLY